VLAASACGARSLDSNLTGSAGTTGTGGAATGGSTGAGGTAGATGHDDCRTDADCPAGVCSGPPCSELLCSLGADGFHHCTVRTLPAPQACSTTSSLPCCTSDAECTDAPRGHCIPYSYQYCGGPAPLPGNDCRYDACTADADCTAQPNGVCTAGTPRACIYGPCRVSADCTAGPGGLCVLDSPQRFCPYPILFCRYADDPCHSSDECPQFMSPYGAACVPNTDLQGVSCQTVPPPPV
jgi:hypothetical protein